MKKKSIFLLITLTFVLISPLIMADIVSINGGGAEGIIINPGANIEGFFACYPKTCASLGYDCNSWADGCGGTLSCGSCSSGYTCTSGVCTSTGGGGEYSGGGGGGEATISPKIIVVPRQINVKLAINTNQKEIIKITNNGDSPKTLFIVQKGLDQMIILGESSLTVAPGETKSFEITLVAPDTTGIFTGKISIGGIEVLVTLNVKTKLLLFDSNIVVLNPDYRVSQGSLLKTKIELIPLGDQERLDVTLNYVIKDYSGKIYLTKSETVLVEEKMQFKRNFGTGMLSAGDYIIGVELIYPGGVAPSSAHFEIVRRTLQDIFAIIIFSLIVIILIVSIIIVTLLIIKRRRMIA